MINLKNFDSNLLRKDKKSYTQEHWSLFHWIHHNRKYQKSGKYP